MALRILRSSQNMERIKLPINFESTEDSRFPYRASVNGEHWVVRINEFPESPSLYTLFVNDTAVEELMEWPNAWNRPAFEIDNTERNEYERELKHFEQTRNIRPSDLI